MVQNDGVFMKEYRNSRRTRKHIKEAFAELVSEKNDINKITVKELVERADISKSTFYAHYVDIYGVAEDFEDEIINLLKSVLDEYNKTHSINYSIYVKELITLLKQNEEMYKKIFASDLPIMFIDKLKDMCNEVIRKDSHIKLLSNDPKKRIAEIDFITNGTIHLFVDYFKGQIPQTLDQIGEAIIKAVEMMYSIKIE